VERSFAWLTKLRRLVRDYETLTATHEAMIWTAATWQLSNRQTHQPSSQTPSELRLSADWVGVSGAA
jgi:hypothetical protein